MKPVKGYIGPKTCLDGEDSHDMRDSIMREDGMEFKIQVCRKCGYWQ